MSSRPSLLVVVCCVATLGHAQTPATDQARFDAAVGLEASGRYADAVTALERFATELPTSPLAVDALREAAEVSETQLFDPARALAIWTRLLELHPEDRRASRASTRKLELERLLADPRMGSAEVGAFTRLLDAPGDAPTPAARREVARFLDEHPGFVLEGRGHLWLGHAAVRAGELDEALRRYDLAARGSDRTSATAQHEKARLLLRRGRLAEAEAAAAGLDRYTDPQSRRARIQLASTLRAARRTRALELAGAVVLALFVLGHLPGLRLRPIPIEVKFLTPIAAIFAGAAAFQPRPSARAVAIIAAGGVIIAWLSQGRSRDPRTLVERILRALAAALAVAALAYLAVVLNGLGPTIIETLKTGPE